ncbi:MAG: ABC transporter ATP-binding protein [Candidatus Cloacimonetes bacterium HGW-Cloacimonetes-3]|jgi:ABC-type lipoprotein export system ATPase subunit|nr:MAG: ABC transporter ATP-binding protein [Candidatus Cloacimonetes bacterium HGW-Cloacimonetes-3]
MSAIITAQNLEKIYIRGSEKIVAVDKVSLSLEEGEFVSFVGPSGSGKTTLLHLLGCLDNPTSGSLSIGDISVFADNKSISEQKLTKIRRNNFGYIFQKFYLIPTLTVKENILLPYAFYKNPSANTTAEELAERLGLSHRLSHLPKELSGGEMQRVAIARALINKPNILLADEPTGNLDSKRSMEIAAILSELNREDGITIILVTHNPALAEVANTTVHLQDGKVIG